MAGVQIFIYLDCKGDREGEYHSEWKAESGEGVGAGTKGAGPGTLRRGEGEAIGALRSGGTEGAPLFGLRKPEKGEAWTGEFWEREWWREEEGGC